MSARIARSGASTPRGATLPAALRAHRGCSSLHVGTRQRLRSASKGGRSACEFVRVLVRGMCVMAGPSGMGGFGSQHTSTGGPLPARSLRCERDLRQEFFLHMPVGA